MFTVLPSYGSMGEIVPGESTNNFSEVQVRINDIDSLKYFLIITKEAIRGLIMIVIGRHLEVLLIICLVNRLQGLIFTCLLGDNL